ncbi:MAG TPA: hypothetical protein VHV79_09695 [Mycobacteriales bacterium]|nr:hypothetical protein [Mycobacteriales bacterium]
MSEASPRASRLAPPRWLDARLVIGVILVLLAVVAGARIFASADRFTSVYVARHQLVPGERLGAPDLSVGQVRFNGEGGSYVAAASRPPVGYLVTRFVAAGEFVPMGALSASAGVLAASRLVTVPVEPGHLPVGLAHGDLVDIYLTPKVGAQTKVPAPVEVLSSVAVEAYDSGSSALSGGSAVSVVLAVPASRVSALVQAVESGTIDLVGVPPAAAGAAPSPVSSATP